MGATPWGLALINLFRFYLQQFWGVFMNFKLSLRFWILTAFILFLSSGGPTAAEDSVCARVKLEIEQTVSLERKIFNARLTINNGLSDISHLLWPFR